MFGDNRVVARSRPSPGFASSGFRAAWPFTSLFRRRRGTRNSPQNSKRKKERNANPPPLSHLFRSARMHSLETSRRQLVLIQSSNGVLLFPSLPSHPPAQASTGGQSPTMTSVNTTPKRTMPRAVTAVLESSLSSLSSLPSSVSDFRLVAVPVSCPEATAGSSSKNASVLCSERAISSRRCEWVGAGCGVVWLLAPRRAVRSSLVVVACGSASA